MFSSAESISRAESEVLHTLIESAYRLALPTLISTGHFHLHAPMYSIR